MMTTQAQEARISSRPMVNNLLVNPNFNIWQRGTPITISTGTGGFTADEWRQVEIFAGSVVAERVLASSGGTYILRAYGNTTPASPVIRQGVSAWKALEDLYVTYTVNVKSSHSTAYISIADYTGGTIIDGWRGDITYHSGSGNWETLTVIRKIRAGLVYPALGATTHSFPLFVDIASVEPLSSIEVSQASLAVGYFPEGVPFSPNNLALDYENCQRFYQRSNSNTYNGSQNFYSNMAVNGFNFLQAKQFPTPMAATPTITLSNALTSGFSTTPNLQAASNNGFCEYRTALSTIHGGYYITNWTAEVP